MNRGIFAHVTTAYIWLLLTLFLFFCGTRGYQQLLTAKFSMFCALCGGYVLTMAIFGGELALIGRTKLQSPLKLWKRSRWTHRFVLAYLLFTWISALSSPRWPETAAGASRYEGALTITIYGLCFLLVSVYACVTVRTLAVFCASVSLFDLLCVLQLAGLNPFQLYPAGYGYADAYTAYPDAYLGTIGNVDLVAAFLCTAIPILWIGLARLRGRARALLLLPLSLSILVLWRISVLAGLVGVLGGGALSLPIVLPLSPGGRKIVSGALVCGALLCTALVYFTDPGSGLLHEAHSVLHGQWDVTFGSGRVYIWKEILEKVPSQLWFGAGPDTMIHAGIEPFTRYDEGLGLTIVSQIDTAHNEYLNILFHQGVFALAAYVLALGSAAWGWVKNSGKDPACAMLGGGVLCYCIQAFFGFSICITAPFFWLALGLLENRNANHEQGEKLCGKNLSA